MRYILSLDLGTTGNRAIVFDENGAIVAQAYQEFEQIFPQPAWVEHDPMAIWETTLSVMQDVMKKVSVADVVGVGITNQRETTILWDRKIGKPVYNAIVWQCRRTAEMCERYDAHRKSIKEKTGLMLDAYFSATKIRWLLENVEGLEARCQNGEIAFGTVDSWLLWQLTKGKTHATDASNASRTLLFNIREGCYDKELLKLFEIPESILPEVRDSGGSFGEVDSSFFGKELPILAVLGDQQAALFAQGGLRPGTVKNTYGTGLFIVAGTGEKIVETDTLVSTVAWSLDGKLSYALEGSIFVGGSVIQWLRDGLKLMADSAESEKMATSLSDNEGVYLVPALVGMGAPYWKPDARGQLSGLTRGTTAAHLVRAALESLAYQTRDVVEVLVKNGFSFDVLCVDGGAAKNDFLMQFQADMLGVRVERPMILESTAFGVAGLAGIMGGLWTAEQFLGIRKVEVVFKPAMSEIVRETYYAGWREAVERCILNL